MQESELRGVTVVMSTHIFDGLEDWGTHIALITGATLTVAGPLSAVEHLQTLRAAGSPAPLFSFVEAALRAEKGRGCRQAPAAADAKALPLHAN